MNGLKHLMFWSALGRIRCHTPRLLLAVFCTASFNAAFAQTGPFATSPEPSLQGVYAAAPLLFIPKTNPLASTGALTFGEWVISPVLRVYSIFDDNLYSSPVAMAAAGLRVFPSLLAQWTNGIHTTSLYGQIDSRIYPSLSQSDTFDRQAGFIQRYEALRDLAFTVQGDYTHETLAPSLRAAIPGSITSPGNPQPPGASGSDQGPVVLNPYDQFTGTATVEKIFNRSYLRLAASFSRTDYESQKLAPDFNVKTFTANSGLWLGPVFYAFSDAEESFTAIVTGTTASAYRVIAGIGTTRIGLFRVSGYFGHQGSQIQEPGTSPQPAGGMVFGGKLAYYPTPFWTISLVVDETQNISNQSSTCSLALSSSTSPTTPLPVPVCDSVWITSVSLPIAYKFYKDWSAYARFDYERIEHIDSLELENVWVTSVGLRYEVRRNIIVTLDYQHTRSTTNVPSSGLGFTRNYVSLGSTCKF